MTITIDVQWVLDAVGILTVLFVVAGLIRTPGPFAYKLFWSALMAITAAAILCNCAPVEAQRTAVEPSSADRCVGLIALACQHDERCGGQKATECIFEQAPPCEKATGLTASETERCAKALVEADCKSPFPAQCLGILGVAPPENPGVSL